MHVTTCGRCAETHVLAADDIAPLEFDGRAFPLCPACAKELRAFLGRAPAEAPATPALEAAPSA